MPHWAAIKSRQQDRTASTEMRNKRKLSSPESRPQGPEHRSFVSSFFGWLFMEPRNTICISCQLCQLQLPTTDITQNEKLKHTLKTLKRLTRTSAAVKTAGLPAVAATHPQESNRIPPCSSGLGSHSTSVHWRHLACHPAVSPLP